MRFGFSKKKNQSYPKTAKKPVTGISSADKKFEIVTREDHSTFHSRESAKNIMRGAKIDGVKFDIVGRKLVIDNTNTDRQDPRIERMNGLKRLLEKHKSHKNDQTYKETEKEVKELERVLQMKSKRPQMYPRIKREFDDETHEEIF